MFGSWQHVHEGMRIPKGMHTFELVERKEEYTGNTSYLIRCHYTQKTLFGFGWERDCYRYMQYGIWDSGGGSWYTKSWAKREEAEKCLDTLCEAKEAESRVLKTRKVGQHERG